LASGVYGLDRWKSNIAGTTLTFTAAVNGNQLTINSTGGIQQVVERQVIPAGNNTLSWEGTATARMYNSGAGAPSYAASPITVNLDGLQNVIVEFTAAGGTRTVSNVKLEAGTTSSAFVLAGLTTQGEIANCERYYIRQLTAGVEMPCITIGRSAEDGASTARGIFLTPNFGQFRATPSISLSDHTKFQVNNFANGVNYTLNSAPSFEGGNREFCRTRFYTASMTRNDGGTGYITPNAINQFIEISAEL